MKLISPPTEAHVHDLAEHMRDADREEAVLLGRANSMDSVLRSLSASAKAWSCTSDGGDLLFIAGAVVLQPAQAGTVYGWVLTTEEADRHQLAVCRGVVRCIREARRQWPVVVLAASAEHPGAVDLVLRLGATPTGNVLMAGRHFMLSAIGRA